tara:strand:+ start:419 stop:1159 length:741 start_codon:yes stop_codon:yes gene_type:complete
MFGKLVVWVLLIFFLIIVLITLYGGKGFIGQVASKALWLQRYLPQQSGTGGVAENPQSIEVRDKLLNIMEANTGSSFCVLDIRAVDFDGLQEDRIILKNDGTGLSSIMQTTSVDGRDFLDDRGAQSFGEETSIAKVCMASPSGSFNFCYSGTGACSTALGVSVGQIKISRGKIHVVNPTNGNLVSHDYFEDYLFKTSSDLYCFLPVYKNAWPGCDSPKRDDGFLKMDKGCIKDLKESINTGRIAKC